MTKRSGGEDFDEVEPRSKYAGFEEPGQEIVGKVLERTDIKNQKGLSCPSVKLQLLEDAVSFHRNAKDVVVRDEFTAGEELSVTGWQVALQERLELANPQPGDVLKIVYLGMVKTSAGGTAKRFAVSYRKGAK